MKIYNIFLCPKCKLFEYRSVPRQRWLCKFGRKEEGLDVDPNADTSLIDPPPICEDFILEGRK